jgi:uncharacterized membrane protein
MAIELVDRMAFFWWDFVASLAWVLQTLVDCVLAVMYACNISFADLLLFLFCVFGGMCDENSCNVFMLLFIMVLWVPIVATLFMMAMFVSKPYRVAPPAATLHRHC